MRDPDERYLREFIFYSMAVAIDGDGPYFCINAMVARRGSTDFDTATQPEELA